MSLPSLAQDDIYTEEDMLGDLPMVTGASHFPQRIADAPNSVSIITRQMIDASAAVEIVDLFRLIPGFQVYFPHYGRQVINYHGVPQENSYRMEVKVDGRSVYEPAENSVMWTTLPVELDDIDYIEVIRGANAPADGANATVASINVITKSPIANQGWRVRATAGDWDTERVSAAYSGAGNNVYYKINAGYRYSSGFPQVKGGEKIEDDEETSYVSLRTIFTPTLYDTIEFQLSYSDSNIDMADSGRSLEAEDILLWNYTNYHISTNWERQLADQSSVEVLFYYNNSDIEAPDERGLFSDILGIDASDVPLFFPGLDDFDITVGLFDSYSRRSDLEFRYSSHLSPSTRYMVGLATRYDAMKSEIQFMDAVDVEESAHRLFSNIESKLSENWTINAGMILEYNDIVHDFSSYRVSANYHINSAYTIKFAYNNGERSPGLYEGNQQSGLSRAGYPLEIDTVAFNNLRSEKFESQEIIFYAQLPADDLSFEIKLYKEKNDDLVKYTILNTIDVFGFSDLDGEFTKRSNSASQDLQGIEAQLSYQPAMGWLLNLQYSYTDYEGQWLRFYNSSGEPRSNDWSNIAPSEMASVTIGYSFSSGFESSVMVYSQSEVEWEQGNESDEYLRTDIRLAKRFSSANKEVLVELIGQNVFEEDYVEFHAQNQPDSRYLLRITAGF
ncbi:MAG: iron complex outermembrane receptor protein [Oceanicoccus sp.]|jgi:iron complex outermembrane receptor protein